MNILARCTRNARLPLALGTASLALLSGKLLQSDRVDGGHAEAQGATSPLTLSPSGTHKFYQVMP